MPGCPSTPKGRKMTDQTSKACTKCKVVKPLTEFYLVENKTRTRAWCKTCFNKDGASRPSQYLPEANLKYRYKMTQAEFDQRLADQGGGCAICHGVNQNETRLSVDHDHSCCPGGRSCGACVRGIICHRCNRLLGFAGDDPEVLRAAVRYLDV